MVDPLSRRLLRGAGTVPVGSGRGPVVLMYHSVENNRVSGDDEWTISRRLFEGHLSLLQSRGWHTACVSELLHPENLPAKTVVITFDDGYADTFENGFALLGKYRMKATWFAVTGRIGGKADWMQGTAGGKSLLSAAQLRQMAAEGMEIGGHTRSHRRLTLLDPQDMQEEIQGSKMDLEALLGTEVISFAYPYGDFSEPALRAVADSGYKIACTARPGWLGSASSVLEVRRVAVFAKDGPGVLARKLAFADNTVGWMRMGAYACRRLRSRLGGSSGAHQERKRTG